jgi:hypothetical protein
MASVTVPLKKPKKPGITARKKQPLLDMCCTLDHWLPAVRYRPYAVFAILELHPLDDLDTACVDWLRII